MDDIVKILQDVILCEDLVDVPEIQVFHSLCVPILEPCLLAQYYGFLGYTIIYKWKRAIITEY